MLSDPLCYLKRAFLRLEYHEFLRFFRYHFFEFRNQVHYRKFLGEQVAHFKAHFMWIFAAAKSFLVFISIQLSEMHRAGRVKIDLSL